MTEPNARSPHRRRHLNVGIVGGSIAGCVTSALLRRAGHDVAVFERSRGNLEDRGVGLAMPHSLLRELEVRDLIDVDMARVPVRRRTFVRRAAEDPYRGQLFWEHPVAFAANHWGVLYRALRKRVPADIFLAGCEVTGLREDANGKVDLVLADGRQFIFDLVVCADGYESVGRRLLYPNTEIGYARYFLWRGMIDEWELPRQDLFEGVMTFIVYEYGHGLIYFVPSPVHGAEKGKRRLNWGFHETVANKIIPGVERDADGFVRKGLRPGAATAEQVAYCRDIARRHFPGYVSEIIAMTAEPFIQPVFDLGLPRYSLGRICLMGDSAALARPHIGGGAAKALDDAIAFADALDSESDLDAALDKWNAERTVAGDAWVELGRAFGDQLVENTPDWQKMTHEAMDRWWLQIMKNRRWYMVDEVKAKAS